MIYNQDFWTDGKILEHSVRDFRKIRELKNRFFDYDFFEEMYCVTGLKKKDTGLETSI